MPRECEGRGSANNCDERSSQEFTVQRKHRRSNSATRKAGDWDTQGSVLGVSQEFKGRARSRKKFNGRFHHDSYGQSLKTFRNHP